MVRRDENTKVKSRESRVKSLAVFALFLLSTFNLRLSTVFCQQPQAQSGQPIYAVNAKYVQGVGPGYWPTAGSGLTLNLSAGTAYCGNPPVAVTYAGGTLGMTDAATNYVYLDPAAACGPAKNTTGFSAGHIPLATVVTAAGAISSVTDRRGWFAPLPCAMSSAGTVTCAALGTNQNVELKPSGTAKLLVNTAGGIMADFTGADDGSGYTGFLVNAVGAGVRPYLGFGNTTTSKYYGNIEADDANNGLKFYGGNRATVSADTNTTITTNFSGGIVYLTPGGMGNITVGGSAKVTTAGTNQDLTITPNGTGQVLVTRVNNVRFADQFSGADAGAKIAAAIADLPSGGGIVDARGFAGNQSLSANLNIGKPVVLLLGRATFALGTYQIQINSSGVEILGSGWEPSTSTDYGTALTYSGTGTAVQVGDGSADRWKTLLKDFKLVGSASGAVGIDLDRTFHARLVNVLVRDFSSGTGIRIHGTNSFGAYNSVEWSRSSNCLKGIHNLGESGSEKGSNANTVLGGSYSCDSLAGSVGLHSAGGTILVIGPDLYNCTIGLKMSGGSPHTLVRPRLETDTTGILVDSDVTAAAIIAPTFGAGITNTMTNNGRGVTFLPSEGDRQWIKQSNLAVPGSRVYDFLDFQNEAGNTLFKIDQNGEPHFINPKDGGVNIYLQAGATAEQNRTIAFRNRTGGNVWTISTAVAGGSTSFAISETGINTWINANSNTDTLALNADGSATIDLNVSNGAGTGGIRFGDGAGNAVASISGKGAARFALNTVTFSATPTFDASLGNTQKITLTGNVTSSTLSNASAGQEINFIVCQDATGGRTFVWPANVKGGMTVGSTLATCSAQNFIFDGTNAYALSAGVASM